MTYLKEKGNKREVCRREDMIHVQRWDFNCDTNRWRPKKPPKTSVLCSGKQEWNQFSALHTWGRCWVNILRVSMAAECCEQPGDEAATPAALNVGVYFGLCCVSGYSYKTHQILKSSQKHICTSGGAGQMFLGRQLAAAVDSNNHAVRHQSQAVLLRLSRR